MSNLDALQAAWDDAVANADNKATSPSANVKRDTLEVPDGDHIVIVRDAGFYEPKSCVYWDLEYPGLGSQKRRLWQGITSNQNQMRILYSQLKALGIKGIKSVTAIPALVEGTVGYKSVITKKTVKQGEKTYENFYFKSVIEKPHAAKSEPRDENDPWSGK